MSNQVATRGAEGLRTRIEALREKATAVMDEASRRDLTGTGRPVEVRLWDARLRALDDVLALIDADADSSATSEPECYHTLLERMDAAHDAAHGALRQPLGQSDQ